MHKAATQQFLRYLAALLALMSCAAMAQERVAVHEYTVHLDANLQTLQVEAYFDGPVDSVAARSRHAGRYLQGFHNCDRTPKIRMRNQRMILPADGIRCMSYSVDLRGAASEQRQNQSLAASNLIASPSLWLWHPEISSQSEVRVRFDLPPGLSVAVPWEVIDAAEHRYRIPQSPRSADAPAAFGRFEYRELDVPGATLRVALMQGHTEMDDESILRWVQAAATDVSLAYGQFPNPSPQVVVIPVADIAWGTGAVPFGRVIRDGGETVELFVNQRQPLTAFLDDWTATHEFSHLMLPYVSRPHRWISEGFAQYYQNVLLARSGAYDEQRAWQKLYDGFRRGSQSRPELSPNDAAARRSSGSTMKIYWSGAAIALLADVALREHSNGEETLDHVLRRLQSCCLPSAHVWSGTELFTTLDSLASKPVFMALYNRYANTSGFPDTGPLFERLGLRVNNGRVQIRRNAALPGIRDAITELDPAIARWRERLAAATR